MIIECPKCKFSQPQDVYCAQCGIDMATFKAPEEPTLKRVLQSPLFGMTLVFIGISAGVYFYLNRVKYTTYSGAKGLSFQVDPRNLSENSSTEVRFETTETEAPAPSPAASNSAVALTPSAAPVVVSRSVAASESNVLSFEGFEMTREQASTFMAGSLFIGEMDRIKAYLLPENESVKKILSSLKKVSSGSSQLDELISTQIFMEKGATETEAQGLNFQLKVSEGATSRKASLFVERNLKLSGVSEVATFEFVDQEWPKNHLIVLIGLVPRKASQTLQSKRQGLFSILNSADYLEGRTLLLVVFKNQM